jgi:type I restriction enzyme S subunit
MTSYETVFFAEAPFEIIDGDRGKNYPKQSEFSETGYCLFLSATNVTKSGFDFAACQFIDQKGDEALNKGKLRREDIVLTTRGTIGNTAYFNDAVPFDHLRINSGMVILRCAPSKLLPAFLYHFVRSPSFFSQVNGLRSGVAQPQLPIRDMRQIKLPLPPLAVQRRIAGILSAYDELIENSQRRIKILESMARALYREWFVHFRYPGHENVPLVDSPLGEIPQGWVVKPLFDLTKVSYGKNLPTKNLSEDGAYPVYGAAKIIGHYTEYTRELRTIICGCRGSVGELQITQPRCYVTNNSFAFDPSTPSNFFWLFQLLKERGLRDVIGGAAQPQITLEGISSVVLLTPPLMLRGRYQQAVAVMFEQAWALESQIQNLRRTRDLLLPRLLSGQIEVEVE